MPYTYTWSTHLSESTCSPRDLILSVLLVVSFDGKRQQLKFQDRPVSRVERSRRSQLLVVLDNQ